MLGKDAVTRPVHGDPCSTGAPAARITPYDGQGDEEVEERPQALARLAKEISELIHNSREQERSHDAFEEQGASRAAPPRRDSEETHRARASVMPERLGERIAEDSRLRLARSGVQKPETHCHSTRSPRDVQVLLASIENREAQLREKVQKLADEKASQQRQFEDEINRLQLANAKKDEELQRQQQRLVDEEVRVQRYRCDDDFRMRKHGEQRSRQPSSPHGSHLQSRTGLSSPWQLEEVRSGRLSLDSAAGDPQAPSADTREELQQQLSEVRAEVARCAQALAAPDWLPASEVMDIREQLSTLGSEVAQTSRALSTAGPRERDAELSEVRQQLGALQAQVSRTMSAALARPTEPSHLTLMRSGDTPGEVRELREEVDRLRSEIMRASSPGVPADPGLADVRAQIDSLRFEMASRHAPVVQPATSRCPAAPPRPGDDASILEQRLAVLKGHVSQMLDEPYPRQPALHDRMSARRQSQGFDPGVRHHRARMTGHTVGSGTPRSGGSMRQELQELRAGVAALAANTVHSNDVWQTGSSSVLDRQVSPLRLRGAYVPHQPSSPEHERSRRGCLQRAYPGNENQYLEESWEPRDGSSTPARFRGGPRGLHGTEMHQAHSASAGPPGQLRGAWHAQHQPSESSWECQELHSPSTELALQPSHCFDAPRHESHRGDPMSAHDIQGWEAPRSARSAAPDRHFESIAAPFSLPMHPCAAGPIPSSVCQNPCVTQGLSASHSSGQSGPNEACGREREADLPVSMRGVTQSARPGSACSSSRGPPPSLRPLTMPAQQAPSSQGSTSISACPPRQQMTSFPGAISVPPVEPADRAPQCAMRKPSRTKISHESAPFDRSSTAGLRPLPLPGLSAYS